MFHDVPDLLPALNPATVRPVVQEEGRTLSLRFDMDTLQSSMDLDDPTRLTLAYTRAMMLFLLVQATPARLLVIGLGGGSLPKYCHRHLPATHITAVEINPHVIALRDTFQVPPDGPRFQVVQADGAAYVRGVARQAGERFDVILLDGFHADGQPEALGTPDFYDACRAALTPEGVLVVNMDGDEASSGPLLARLECAFDGGVESLLSEGGSNRVAFAGSPALLQQARRTRRQRLKALSPVHQSMLVQRGGASAGWPILPHR